MTKLSEQQEKFCRNIVEGMSQAEAYAKAGYSDNGNNAYACSSRLLRNAKIADRIQVLREKATEGTEVTLQWLIEQAVGVLTDAREDGSHAASIAAIKELGVLTGERVEKRQNENINRNAEDFSEAELEALISSGSSSRATEPEDSAPQSHKVH